MTAFKNIRYAVDAVFGDGKHVTLRDFKLARDAERWLQSQARCDFYPGRVYRLVITAFDVEDFRDFNHH